MYLKSLEMCGFKSFADKTKLVFEPGLIAIVGPNGCGKSNVSDAIRWVLGEQRPSALRGSKMLDVVFNGTDTRKPMTMAEVSITFSDCEGTLETDYHEVTITRRVFRTGDGSYFINKTPCRLKDIHRLFMGTGVGTTSYSVMAQGQIDAILSSKPEDRRTIFEEAAGITKYKADRKEAMRKLEQTEANLLRLADVIREVKRQISSLERQVSRAERYKQLKAELRAVDIFAAKHHISTLNLRLDALENELRELAEREANGNNAISESEALVIEIRRIIAENEDAINEATESAAQDEGKLEHAKELIRIGEERLMEYRSWSERDTREAAQIKDQLLLLEDKIDALQKDAEDLEIRLEGTIEMRENAEERTQEARAKLDEERRKLAEERNASYERERTAARLQQTLGVMEASLRESTVKKERLLGEKEKLERDIGEIRENCDIAADEYDALLSRAEMAQERCNEHSDEIELIHDEINVINKEINQISNEISAENAKINLLREQEEKAKSSQSGSHKLLTDYPSLDLTDNDVLGTIAEKFNARAEYRNALEAVLRAWIDAVVVCDGNVAKKVISKLCEGSCKPATRMVVADAPHLPYSKIDFPRLIDAVEPAYDFRDAAERLLGGVYIVPSFDAIPPQAPAGLSFVTLDGAVFHSDGTVELWSPSEAESPLARRLAITDGEEKSAKLADRISQLKITIEERSARESSCKIALDEAKREQENFKRFAAQKEGELSSIKRDLARCEERLEVVTKELEEENEKTHDEDQEKLALAAQLEEIVSTRDETLDAISRIENSLRTQEDEVNQLTQELTEARLAEANRSQELAQARGQISIYKSRQEELMRSLEGRSMGMRSYDDNIAALTQDIERTKASLAPLTEHAAASRTRLEELKGKRKENNDNLDRAENRLTAARMSIEAIHNRQTKIEVEKAELNIRRQNRLDLIFGEYGLSMDSLFAEETPDLGENGELSLEDAEKRITELSAAIQELGPVNLVAIDEYNELVERYNLEKAQEDDLIKSKDELIELLKMINQKSLQMFRETFEQANTNFETMFTKLFGGGTAKLVMIDNPDDPLECGVEIIARPPGKRPQSISLLSGGERTMTAVSLLFAIYLIKPSPFCLLDELDAALDDSNIGRFVQALKDFLVQSQFLIITHNQHSIANSGIVYGVTMPEKGISKIVSMRLPEMGLRSESELTK